jgi:hypothetical protein
MKSTILQVRESWFGGIFAILLMASLSGGLFWWAVKRGDHIDLIIASIASVVWMFMGYIVSRSLYRGRSAVLSIDDGRLTWTITYKQGGRAPNQGSISLQSIRTLELLFWKVHGEGKNYQSVDAFLVDVAGKRHQLPDALLPGVYYKRILKAIQQVRPSVVLNEKFHDSDDVREAPE